MRYWWGKSLLLLLLSVFLVSYQNCSWNESDSNFRGAQSENHASLTGGDTYDGKPEADYIRRVPGYTCGGAASEYGSLNILGDSALLTLRDGEQCSEEIRIKTSDLYSTPNTDAVLGYKEGIYTKSDSVLSTSPDSFTEVWCQHKSDDKTQVLADIVVQWEQAGHTVKGYVFTSDNNVPAPRTLTRKIDIHQIRYGSESLRLVIHRVSKAGGEDHYEGYYQDVKRFGDSKHPVQCRLGGQFDPSAPQLMYPQSSITFEIGRVVDNFVPVASHSSDRFQIDGPLPEGLTFDATTGRISGTPVSFQKRTPYEITMKFKFGEIRTPVFIGTGQRVRVTSTDLSAHTTTDGASCLNGDSPCFLRSALSWANAQPDKPLIIDLPAGAYDVAGQELVVKGNVTLNGSATDPTIFDAGGLSRIFRLEPGAFVELNRLQLMNGRAPGKGGALMAEEASVVIKSSRVQDNSAATSADGTYGGAVYVSRGDSLEIYDSKFLNNKIEADSNPLGGGVYSVHTQRVIVKRSEFRKNVAPFGGAIYLDSVWNGLNYFKDNQFVDNHGVIQAGAMFIDDGYIYVDASLFDGNTAGFDGGGLYINQPNTMKVTNSTFTGGAATLGSVFYFRWHRVNGMSVVRNNQFIDNSLGSPTGLGTADGKGVLIYLREGSLILQDSVFRDNLLHETCKVRYLDGIHGFGVKSFGGNTFEDRTCQPTDGDIVTE